jgi:hypothetical protein
LSALQQILKNWERDGVSLLPPMSEARVIEALAATGQPVSKDLIALYCLTGGMESGCLDNTLWSLWPIEEVVAETSRFQRPYIYFADWLINSHYYCLKYEDEQTSSVLVDDGNEPRQVAGSLAEFFETYLKDTELLEIWDLDRKRSG